MGSISIQLSALGWMFLLAAGILLPQTELQARDSTRFVGLGQMIGGTSSRALDVSADGRVVVGSATSATGPQGLRWTESAGLQLLSELSPRSVSGDGSVIIGVMNTDLGPRGFRWSGGGVSILAPIAFSEDPRWGSSFAMGISANGSIIAGYSTSDQSHTQATSWSGGMPVGLGLGPGGDASYADNVSPDGIAIVGRYRLNEPSPHQISAAFRSVGGGEIQSLGAGGNLESQAHGVSNGGRVVVGALTATYLGPLSAALWTESGGWEPLRGTAAGSIAWDVSGDGSVIVGSMAGMSRAFIWEPGSGARDLKQVLEGEYGLNLTGWTLTSATAVDSAGSVIVGEGIHNGTPEGWWARVHRLRVTAPSAGELWIAGERDTIRWKGGRPNQHLRIDFSPDSGVAFQPFGIVADGDAGLYVWEIPQEILSRKCRVRILDLADTTNADSSDLFRIKGYVLTRDSSGQYVQFRPEVHGWSFANLRRNMWPFQWWQQFDYSGTDPNTGKPYPSSWFGWPVNASYEDFPDWPLFVKTFGVDQCYHSTTLPVYGITAVTIWAVNKGNTWHGSCHGFSVSSMAAFTMQDEYRSYFGLPTIQNLSGVGLSDLTRLTINQCWTAQYGQEDRLNDLVWFQTPNETLDEIRTMLLSDDPDKRVLIFREDGVNNFGQGFGFGAHSVLPYKVTTDQADTTRKRVYIYDNAYPGAQPRYILFRTADNGWVAPDWGWDGDDNIYLSIPVSHYLRTPSLLSPSGVNKPSLVPPPSSQLTVYTPQASNVCIRNAANDSIGVNATGVFNSFQDATPLMPLTSTRERPAGFVLAAGTYSVQIDSLRGNRIHCAFHGDSVLMLYGREDADSTQVDQLTFDGGLTIHAGGPAERRISVRTVLGGSAAEKVLDVIACTTHQGNTLRLSTTPSDGLRIAHAGIPTTYEIRIEMASAGGSPSFRHALVHLPSDASHIIAPDWQSLTGRLRVYVDLGSDGAIDDTLDLANEATDVGEEADEQIPRRFGLKQNFPNPFNPSTTIHYHLPAAGRVLLTVYDMLGREVAVLVDRVEEPGYKSVRWDATGVASGVYYYRLRAGDSVETRKLLVMR